MNDVAAVLVTLNSREDVVRNLAELRAQRGVRLEIVAVDNGSADGTEGLLAAQPDVRLIANRENRWLSPAWSQAVKASASRYLLFLNPDLSLPDPDAVSRLVAALDADKRAALAGPRLFDEQGNDLRNGAFAFPSVRWIVLSALGLDSLFGRDRKPEPVAAAGDRPVVVPFVNGACMLIRRSALEAIGGIDERYPLYWEEIDLARRLTEAGYRTLLVPSVRGVHRGKGTPAAPGVRERAWARGERLYLTKHHGRSAVIVVRAARAMGRARRKERSAAAEQQA